MQNLREIEINADDLVNALLSLESVRRLSLLDSCGLNGGGLLIAGFDPFEVIEVRKGRARIIDRDSDKIKFVDASALSVLDERLAKYRLSSNADSYITSAACITTFSYELAHQLERLRSVSVYRNEFEEPDAVFAFYDTLVVHDYDNGKTYITGIHKDSRLKEIEDTIRNARKFELSEVSLPSSAISNMTRGDYLRAIERIKDHIAAGDIYQANLTQRFKCALPNQLTPEQVFMRLRNEHPAAFSAFIRRSDDVVISISPERFLRVENGEDSRRIVAQPIKGTRPRGKNQTDDVRLRTELQSSEKDRAENVMIVDLLRNDLGRICQYGSVEVEDLCRLEEHPTLFHLVSTVRGMLEDDVTAGDILRACFPCGSITGAPKIRAMEIINEIESVPRGLSMGAIGYFAFDGSIDLNVAIRTMTVRDGVAEFNVGGGIVADSDPQQEYEESLLKAGALFRAMGVQESSAGQITSR